MIPQHYTDPARAHRPDVVKDPLHVISVLYNPMRYRSRWKLYKNYEKYIIDSGAKLYTIECTYGERQKVVVEPVSDNHTIIHVQTSQEVWLKENLINIAIQRLPEDWKYVAWIDADIMFSRPDWVGETIHQLQRYSVLQLFSEAIDLGPDYEILKIHKGFMHVYHSLGHTPCLKDNAYYGGSAKTKIYMHPGFCWAARREAINHLGGLLDWAVLGGGDMYMAYALIGALNSRSMPQTLGKSGIRMLSEWQKRAEKYIKRNVGYVSGTVFHYWHGAKVNRAYKDRGQILIDAKFEPDKDLFRDWQGLYQINPDNIKLRDGARKYYSLRNEDGIEVK